MNKTLNQKDIKVLGLSSLGGTLEFYDFIIFVFFANYISTNFFPKDLSSFWQMFNTYGIFAAGYLARPLGGVILAHFGDKFGRKRMFMISILLMVIPTFTLAFIPNYESIGFLCIVLLVFIRICQGIAIGGELPGAWVFVYEHAPQGQKRTYLGILTASVVGGIFGIISAYLRKFLRETPVFEQMKKDKALEKFPLKEVFKKAKMGIVLSMMITWVLTGCIVVMILLMPSYMAKILQINTSIQTYLQIGGILLICLGCIISGILADKISVIKSCVFFSVFFGIASLLYFNTLYRQNADFNLVACLYLLVCFFSGVMNFCPLIMSEVFDAKIKFSGLSFSYNIAYAIAGGLTPQLAFFLHSFALNNLSNFWRFSLGLYVFFLAIIALLCAFIFSYLNNTQRTYSQ
ncbi:MFS transporter [Campylobacter jejuni]|nr:MFS transporter [Campylobacter jejuni]EIS8258855.1 MFS transporter [Campylobacter jejuni]